MIYIDWSKVSNGEKKAVAEIRGARECPICPACGNDMELCVNEYRDEYISNYLCKHCNNWGTQSSKNKSLQLAVEDAYKKATAVNTAVRHYFLAQRRVAV